jgi:uncharacterized protein (UPF0210 family)
LAAVFDAGDFLQTRRVTVTPLEVLGRSFVRACCSKAAEPAAARQGLVDLAVAVDEAVRTHLASSGVFLGGAGFLAEKGVNRQREVYFDTLPEILRRTQIFNASINVGSTQSGIDLEAVRAAAGVISSVAEDDIRTTKANTLPSTPGGWRWGSGEESLFLAKTRDIRAVHPQAETLPFWSRLARLAVFVNAPTDNPFMAGGFSGPREPEMTISIGINGAGVLARALEVASRPDHVDLTEALRSLKFYSGLMYRVTEAIRYEVIRRLRAKHHDIDDKDGVVDLSIAATDDRDAAGTPTNSIARALEMLGIPTGCHGTLAGIGLLIDTVKKSGAANVTYSGGLSGTFIPVSEDAGMADAAARGHLGYDRYLAMTSVCSVGVDMVPVWVPESLGRGCFEDAVAGMLLDEAAIGVYCNKTTSVRLIAVHHPPAPNRWVVLLGGAGLLGASPIFDAGLDRLPLPSRFVHRSNKGRIPAPITSLRN